MRDLTRDEIEAFAVEGTTLVRSVVGVDWLSRLRELAEALVARPGKWVSDTGELPGAGGRALDDRYLWRENPVVREFVFESGIAALVGQAMGSREVRFYFDHWLVKEPGNQTQTPWHQDVSYWPFDGAQIASAWLPLTPVDASSSTLELVKGSHLWGTRFRPERFVPSDEGSGWIARAEGETLPDIESRRASYEIATPAMSPGDVLIFSAWTVHASTPNRSKRRRAAVSTRWLGDDARWQPHEAADPTVTQKDVSIQPGELARDDERFPLVWRRS